MRLTRGQAIRAKCLDCCCGSRYEVKMCVCDDCPLYPYRLGHEEKGGNLYPEDCTDEESDSTIPVSGERVERDE